MLKDALYLLKSEKIVTEINWDEGKLPGDINSKIKSVKLYSTNNSFVIENKIFIEMFTS